ncbi:MAG: hypothetical protein HYT87_11750 [Nitrospirae bacterium]|nr:hypothetical protein [Nitrospirota bacterium]
MKADIALFGIGAGLGLLFWDLPFVKPGYSLFINLSYSMDLDPWDFFFQPQGRTYRPLQTLLNLGLYHLWGTRPGPYHLVPMLCLAGTAVAVRHFLLETGVGRRKSFAISCLSFATLPFIYETMAGTEPGLISMASTCAALLCLLRSRKGKVRWGWMAGFLAFSLITLLSKEIARAFFIPILLLTGFFFGKQRHILYGIMAVLSLTLLTTLPLMRAVDTWTSGRIDIDAGMGWPFLETALTVNAMAMMSALGPQVGILWLLGAACRAPTRAAKLVLLACSLGPACALLLSPPIGYAFFAGTFYFSGESARLFEILGGSAVAGLAAWLVWGDDRERFFSSAILTTCAVYAVVPLIYKETRVEPTARHFIYLVPWSVALTVTALSRAWTVTSPRFPACVLRAWTLAIALSWFYSLLAFSTNAASQVGAIARAEWKGHEYVRDQPNATFRLLSPGDAWDLASYTLEFLAPDRLPSFLQTPRIFSLSKIARTHAALGSGGEFWGYYSRSEISDPADRMFQQSLNFDEYYGRMARWEHVYVMEGLKPSPLLSDFKRFGKVLFRQEERYTRLPLWFSHAIQRRRFRLPLIEHRIYPVEIFELLLPSLGH